MKKMITMLLSLTLMVSLSACGNETPSSSEGTQPSVSSSAPSTDSSVESTESTVQSEISSQEEQTEETGKTLVAYFSWSGNTEQMAGMIAEETGAELFEIAPASPYTEDYNDLLDVAQQEQRDNARPELSATVENWDSYDVIFVGYPNWWNDAPMLIYSFLESYDWTGKTLVPFCTSGGSAFGRSLDKLPESAAGATILEGLHIGGSRVSGASEDIASWVDSLGLQ